MLFSKRPNCLQSLDSNGLSFENFAETILPAEKEVYIYAGVQSPVILFRKTYILKVFVIPFVQRTKCLHGFCFTIFDEKSHLIQIVSIRILESAQAPTVRREPCNGTPLLIST